MTVEREFDTLKDLVSDVLKHDEMARNNDTHLYFECCKKLGATIFDDLEKLNLNITSVHKLRQQIQNKMGLYKPSESVQKERNRRKINIKEYLGKLKAAN
ncbi:hypothetical protein [Ectobacillus polymachus]|uniref:hypothetical protein n=1 Tax=Ectobacillus polymachus TaxID=1508806 RepID=UPI003A85EA14